MSMTDEDEDESPAQESDDASLNSGAQQSYPDADDGGGGSGVGDGDSDVTGVESDVPRNDSAHAEAEDDGDEDEDEGASSGSSRSTEPEDHIDPADDEDDGASSSTPLELGGPDGSAGVPAYALLVGKIDPAGVDGDGDDRDGPDQMVSIPITCLPATLGRDHAAEDPSFIGLQTVNGADAEHAQKLSQSMCCIYYRDAHGGMLGQYRKGREKDGGENDGDEAGGGSIDDPLQGMVYKPYEVNLLDDHDKGGGLAPPSPDDIMRPPGVDASVRLPSSGFFAIECTGRKIVVGGRALRKGQSAMLYDGAPIRIASHCLYFLLPKPSVPTASKPPPSIRVKVSPPPIRPDRVVSSTERKEKEGAIGSGERDASASTLPPPAKKPRRSDEFVLPFEDRSDQQLLQLLSEKITESTWDHEGQKLGSALATRVCRAAARSSVIQRIVRDEGGVTQREIMDWMNDDPASVFGDYERMMLAKIERKSFMMSIGKALPRAGYVKNEFLSGRAFRWNLPEDVEEEDNASFRGESAEEGEADNIMKGCGDVGEGEMQLSGLKSEDFPAEPDEIKS